MFSSGFSPARAGQGGEAARRLLLTVLAALMVSGVQAQSTWIGGVGSLYVATNWSGGTVPQSFDSIIITNGGTVQSDNTADVANTSIGGGSTYAVLPGILSYFTPDNVYLGTFGTGTLTVGSQAEMAAAADLYVGYASNATGVVTADGGYLSPFTTYIGYEGSGTMTLTNGSTLQSTFGHVGYAAGSTGLVQLSDSTWKAEISGSPVDITVGRQGNGEVQATNSTLSSQNLVLGDSAGATGSVSASGGTITVANDTQVGNGGTGNLNLSNSATMTTYGLTVGVLSNSIGRLSVANSSLTSSQSIFLGLSGAGTLTTDGASIKAPQIFIARNAGSTGTATVSGGLTELTGELHVGAEGNGTFTLQGAGTLTTDKANMGFAAGSKGTANILNGTWSNKQAIFVGVSGEGTLNIGAQGSIVSESGYISQNVAGVGAVNITGGSWTMTNTLVVGVRGTGTLSASNGAQISSEWAQLGLTNGSSGTATLDDSSLTVANDLTIGELGSGTLLLTNGAHLAAGAIELAAASGVSGSLTVVGSTVTTESILAGSGNATVSFSSARLQLPTNVVVVDTLLIDGFASGNVVIGSGGLTVDTRGGNAQIGSPLSGAGSLTKTGAGRLRLDTANTYAGGTTVEGGVLELTGNSNLGAGNVTLSGGELRAFTNSTVSGDLNGGIQLVSVAAGQTGTFSALAGQTFTLAPLDFLLVAGSTMQVGSAGNTGNVVFAPTGAAALAANTAINVAAGTLTAGNNELGFMTSIAASTTVASGATLNFQDNLSSGGINALFGGGTVNIGTNPSTTLTVNSGNFAGNIAGSGALLKESAGTLTLSGQNAFIGGTTVNAGTLVVDGDLSFGLGEVTVNSGGTFGGSGIVGTVTLNGGSVSPGSSPGTLTAQNLFWQDGLLVFELGPTADVLDLTGALEGFGTNYGFSFVDAGWAEGSTYTLVNFFTNTIAVDDFYFVNGGGFAGTFTTNSTSLQFTVTTVPEPSTWALLLVAGLLAAIRFRRSASARSND